jgi:selenide,water dikinase
MNHRQSVPLKKRLVLLGGGHSHLAVLMSLAKDPVPGLDVTLISRDVDTPYSGALPAFISGHAQEDDFLIDLRPLAQMAGARLIQASVEEIDLVSRTLRCAERPAVHFDILSLNLGSRPDSSAIPGAERHAISVKPLAAFLERWEQIQRDYDAALAAGRQYTLAIVGGGPASVELACAMQEHLHKSRGPKLSLRIMLVCGRPRLLWGLAATAGALALRTLQERDIEVRLNCRVLAVEEGQLRVQDTSSGQESRASALACNATIIATGAAASPWLQSTGLALDARGFVRVNNRLQSMSHPFVFAAGDIAAIAGQPRPKAGVYAVRQGMPLARNLRRFALGESLLPYSPQTKALALLYTGNEQAIATRGQWAAQGHWAWRWKDWIDKRFVAKYAKLAPPPQAQEMRCAGCAAKVSSHMLGNVLSTLHPCTHEDILSTHGSTEDASIIHIDAGRVLLQTVDHFRAFVNDPYLFARIATVHCLSDIHAMGATSHSALAIVSLPHAAPDIMQDQMQQVMTGCTEVLNAHQTALIGGHTGEAGELSFGLSVNAFAAPDKLLRKTGLRTGDRLILCKALGTGTLFAADMRYQARQRWIAPALAQMQQSNLQAAQVFLQHGAHACTDVTGFGLLGHLREMCGTNGTELTLWLETLPVLEGALHCLEKGWYSSLHGDNARHAEVLGNAQTMADSTRVQLLYDPQTSGGLLAAVSPEQEQTCIAALHAAGYPAAVCIGAVTRADSGATLITLQAHSLATGGVP